VLVKMLDDADPKVALTAASVLSEMRAPETTQAIPMLIRGFKTGGWKEAGYAIPLQLLQSMGQAAREAAPALLALLADPESWRDRDRIVEALTKIGADVRVVRPFLEHRLQDEEQLPWAAILAARLDPEAKSTVPALMVLLCFDRKEHRQAAVLELLKLGPRARLAVPRLEQALEDADEQVRYQSAVALIRITGKKEPYADFLLQGMSRHEQAIRALELLPVDSPWAVEALVEALSRPEPIRGTAINILEHFGQAARPAVPALLRLLKEEQTNSAEKPLPFPFLPESAIVRTLGAIGPAAKEAAPLLRKILANERFGTDEDREEVRKALRQIEGEPIPGKKP
jgi:HEAT repeat protein